MLKKNNRLVYSTETGRACPDCEHPVDDCRCSKDTIPDGDGIVRIYLDRKGRKGKGVTLITGIPLSQGELKSLSKELKKKCGVGGSVKNHDIEIQGDHRDLLVELLSNKGFVVKKASG